MGCLRYGTQVRRLGLYLGIEPDAGGAFQYSLSMLDAVGALPRSRFEPVAVYASPAWKHFVARASIEGICVPISWLSALSSYAWRKLGFSIPLWRQLAARLDPRSRQLIAMQQDLWIYPAQDPMAYMLPAASLATVHDLMHRYEPRFPEVSGYRMREIHYQAICWHAAAVLVDSEVGREQLVDSYGIDPTRVHPLHYVAPYYLQGVSSAPGFEQRYSLPSKYFLYPAQFWEHKNHAALVRAAHSLLKAQPDIALVFVGAKKNGYGNVMELIRRLGMQRHVYVLGYVPNSDVTELYRRARALIMPTFFGPTNIPPLEAMAVGCPVAVSRIYAMPEQCQDAALYFDPRSDEEIARAMCRLWVDDTLCAELSRRGRERAGTLSQSSFNNRLLAILETVFGDLARSRRNAVNA